MAEKGAERAGGCLKGKRVGANAALVKRANRKHDPVIESRV